MGAAPPSSDCGCPEAGAPCGAEGIAAAGLAPAAWRRVAAASAFTLAPPGHNFETFRYYEAAEAGTPASLLLDARRASASSPRRPPRKHR